MSTSERSCTHFSTRRKYGVIYADPPWSFRNWSAKGTGRNAVSHYDCLDFQSLASLPVAKLAADDCALFLWATDPLLPRAFELIERWGFEYKTVAFYWVKLNSAAKHDADYFTGLGYWTRANPEQCLLATRGKPPRLARNVKRLIVEKRGEHSRKPDCACASASSGSSAGRTWNCSRARPSGDGTAGAIRLPCSIEVLSSRGVSHLGSLMRSSCRFKLHVGFTLGSPRAMALAREAIGTSW
jgi:N6-adenosine-specific RNA methylase IME4